jgi:hypothetical protein
MNPDNSFAWRNLGAYYLGRTHLLSGNMDLSKIYLDKSRDLDEYNDSVIEQ